MEEEAAAAGTDAAGYHLNTVRCMETVSTMDRNAKQRQKATLTVQPTPTCKTDVTVGDSSI